MPVVEIILVLLLASIILFPPVGERREWGEPAVTSDQEPSVVVETDAPGVVAGSGAVDGRVTEAASDGGGAGDGAAAVSSAWPAERPRRTLLPLGITRRPNNKG